MFGFYEVVCYIIQFVYMVVNNCKIMMGVFVFLVKMLETLCDLPYFHFLSNDDLQNLQLHDSLTSTATNRL